jgi:signal transduction histidine kinase/ActR/RegA family two-component response regulator
MSQDIAPFGFSLIFILFALYSYRSRLDNLRRMALSDVFNSYKNAIVLLNNYNIVEEANAAFHAYFPGCEIQPLKTKIGDLYSYFETEAQDAGSRELFEAERRDGTYCAKGDYVLRLPESQTMTFTVNRQEVRNANGRMTGWLLTLSDVSTYHRMIEEINQQNEQLAIHKEAAEAASEAKSIFLATMSHEMRTPLNAIIGLSEMALRRDSDATTKANIVKVHRSGINLLNVINDILDISKIESGRFELLPITYNTADLIHEAVATNRVRIGLKPIEFILKVDENLPTQLVGDELRVKQIFNNLLSNAIKYTHEGTVTLDISCRVTETDVWLRLQVSDTGIGIKPEDIPNLFLEYQQVDMKANRRVEGTGLGLSITEHLAQLMGGEIEVSSIYGTGSTFSATIHQVAASSESIGAATARTLEEFSYLAEQQAKNDNFVFTDIPHSRFLVVDDVEVNVEVARGMLEPYDAEVDCLDSGQAAVDAIRKAEPRYDLIFMDHMMPGMDGIEAVHIIRSEIGTEYAKNIPIVALTASAMVGSREMFLEEGFQDFLAKPIDFKLLDAILVRWKAQRESGVYDLRSKDTVILENS